MTQGEDIEGSDPVRRPGLSAQAWSAIARRLGHRWEGKYRRGLYSPEQLEDIRQTLDGLARWLADHRPARLQALERDLEPRRRFSARDALCISYVDHVASPEPPPPARVLQRFFNRHLKDAYNHVHILPHFPCPVIHPELRGPASRADGGFEPMSYQMDPRYGEPEDLMGLEAGLMYDFVLNHLSVKSEWFRRFLEDEPGWEDFFLTIPADRLDDLDLSGVFRPRQHHPVIEFTNSRGEKKYVWCTFSPTQADLNIKNPRVFQRLMEALIKDFIGQGAEWIRLDAVGYLVKMLGLEPGEPRTSCFGIEETHDVLKVLHTYLGEIAPAVTLVAEVNATKDVIRTYYGAHGDEAHMAYEFPVAPLSLFAIYRGDTAPLTRWAREKALNPEQIGLSFTSSHDGIGVLPMTDVPELPDGTPALAVLIEELEGRGAGINYKSQIVAGGQRSIPYEACITWLQAVLTGPERQSLLADGLDDAQLARIADRFVVSQAFAMTAPHCVPADYLGAITGQLNDEQTFAITGHNRDKNRGLIDAVQFERILEAPLNAYERLVHLIVRRKRLLWSVRAASAAFSPYARCEVGVVEVDGGAGEATEPVFSVLRRAESDEQTVLVLINSTDSPRSVRLDAHRYGLGRGQVARDLLSQRNHPVAAGALRVPLGPWGLMWLDLYSDRERGKMAV